MSSNLIFACLPRASNEIESKAWVNIAVYRQGKATTARTPKTQNSYRNPCFWCQMLQMINQWRARLVLSDDKSKKQALGILQKELIASKKQQVSDTFNHSFKRTKRDSFAFTTAWDTNSDMVYPKTGKRRLGSGRFERSNPQAKRTCFFLEWLRR